MDTKKTNLTPELKEIYDRVMNTSGAKATATAGTPPLAAPAPSEQIPTSAPQPAMPVGVPPTSTITPNLGMPASPSLGGSPSPTMSPPPGMPPAPTAPAGAPPQPSPLPPLNGMPSLDSTAEQALSSTPARPVSEGNTFSFSGTAHQIGRAHV